MLKGHILCKKGKQNTLLRKDIMSKSASFFAEIVFFFLRKGHFFLMFFFPQTHWEDWDKIIMQTRSIIPVEKMLVAFSMTQTCVEKKLVTLEWIWLKTRERP